MKRYTFGDWLMWFLLWGPIIGFFTHCLFTGEWSLGSGGAND